MRFFCFFLKKASYGGFALAFKGVGGVPDQERSSGAPLKFMAELHFALIFGVKDKAASTHQHLFPARHCVLACLKNGHLSTPTYNLCCKSTGVMCLCGHHNQPLLFLIVKTIIWS